MIRTQSTYGRSSRMMALIITLAIVAVSGFAQEPSSQVQPEGSNTPKAVRREQQRGSQARESAIGVGKFLSALDLSAEQKQQLDAILAKHKSSNAGRLNELRQLSEQKRLGATIDVAKERSVRKQIREESNKIEAEVFAILTPDQQATVRRKRQELMTNLRTR